MFFCLFASCKVVLGSSRSTICDIERGKVYFIPNELAGLLNEGFIAQKLIPLQFKDWIEEFVSSELGFWTQNPEYFPKISLDWDSPELINNAILEMDFHTMEDIEAMITQLNGLHCKFVEFRYYHKFEVEKFAKILPLLTQGTIRGFTIFLPFHSLNGIESLSSIYDNTVQLQSIIIHSAPKDLKGIEKHEKVLVTDSKIDSTHHCGKVSPDYFSINISTFTESQSYNTCLNRKISVDLKGNIKNCPSTSKVFGNIKSDSLIEIAKDRSFQKLWHISKDQVNVCKSCEFRYVCTDCRAYLENPDDIFSKPLKCGYNPETTEWQEWSVNPIKSQSIKYYKLDQQVK